MSCFLWNTADKENFDAKILDIFAQLDDIDIYRRIKQWQNHEDFVLSELCKMIINRRLLHIKIKKEPISEKRFQEKFQEILKKTINFN